MNEKAAGIAAAFVSFIQAIRSVEEAVRRGDAPEVRGHRVLRPDLRLLRPVAVPRAGLEVAELLVVHPVQLGEELGQVAVGIVVIGEEVMPDAVATRAPHERITMGGEIVAGGLDVAPVAELEGDVVDLGALAVDEVDGVMVGPAAQEGEEVAHPVGDAEAEHVAVEGGDLLHVDDVEGDVSELQRHDALLVEWLRRERALAEDFQDRALRIGEGDHLRDRRLGGGLPFHLDAVGLDLFGEGFQVPVRCDLEGEAVAFGFAGLAQDDRVVVEGAGEIGGVRLPLDQGEAQDLRVIVDLTVEIRRQECGVRDAFHSDHEGLPGVSSSRWSGLEKPVGAVRLRDRGCTRQSRAGSGRRPISVLYVTLH